MLVTTESDRDEVSRCLCAVAALRCGRRGGREPTMQSLEIHGKPILDDGLARHLDANGLAFDRVKVGDGDD